MVGAHEGYLRADDGLDAQGAGSAGEIHGPAEVVVVGDGQGGIAQAHGAGQQLLDKGRPFLEGVVAMAVELGIALNHCGVPIVLPSTPRRALGLLLGVPC